MSRGRQAGFTVVEMAIALVVAGFLAAAIFVATFDYYADLARSNATADMSLESQTILTQMTEDIRLADAISATNAISDPNQPGGWVTSNPGKVIIIEDPAVDSAHNVIYNPDTGFPYRNEYIYFTSGNTMYKRILANPDAPGNTAVTTCPAAVANSSCPPDRLFSANANSLSFTFYDNLGNVTSDTSSTRSVDLQVDMSKQAFGKAVTFNDSTRVTLRNQ